MTAQQIAEMRELEAECLAKFERVANKIQRDNPRLTPAQCNERAMTQLPNSYAKYQAAREWRKYTTER